MAKIAGGTRKIGRNKDKCARYKQEHRKEKNKIRKWKKMLKGLLDNNETDIELKKKIRKLEEKIAGLNKKRKESEMDIKLRTAWLKFNYASYKKLTAKERRGFTGWDKQENKELLEEGLMEHIKKPLTQSNLVDIADYCNFLWNLIENEKKKVIK